MGHQTRQVHHRIHRRVCSSDGAKRRSTMTGWRKYWRPRSVTFWSSAVPLSLGLFVAFTPVHGLTEWTYSIDAVTGNIGPYGLINAGLVGIGLRAAL